jgi:toxin YhaV
MKSPGWTLLFHDCVSEQLRKLKTAADKTEAADPEGFESNSNVKLFRALNKLILEVVPGDPSRDEYRQGNTLGESHRHWRRVKFMKRFRLFFRYDSRTKIIVYAWVNDDQTLRKSGSKSDPYAVFQKMLERGNPPDSWEELVAQSCEEWTEEAV